MSEFIPAPHKKTIGILGGMGPAASALLYQRLIATAQQRYQAEQDTDYPPLFIYNLPLRGFDETGFTDPLLVRQQLINGVQKLAAAGSDFIIIACNTVHYFLPAMQAAVSVPIMSIIEEAVKKVVAEHYSVIGVLGSASTARLLVYQHVLENSGIKVVLPNYAQQVLIDEVIVHVMSGKQGEVDVGALQTIIIQLQNQGAQAIILGCTELPLAINRAQSGLPLLDTIQIMVEAALEAAVGDQCRS